MRTRIYNKMTTPEIEGYLAGGGDTIFVAVGVVECHGHMPVDVESIGPEAYCKLLAEKADGLALINLPYFYPASTIISDATIQVSITEGISYLKTLTRSLISQGFTHIFFVSGHGPAGATVDAVCAEIFSETLIHPCHLARIPSAVDAMAILSQIDREKGPTPEQQEILESFTNKSYGAYKIMGQMEYLPVDPNHDDADDQREPTPELLDRLSDLCRTFGGFPQMIYADSKNHGGGRIFKSKEERLAVCTKGEELMCQDVDACPILELKQAVTEYHDYIQKLYEKHPRIKPGRV